MEKVTPLGVAFLLLFRLSCLVFSKSFGRSGLARSDLSVFDRCLCAVAIALMTVGHNHR